MAFSCDGSETRSAGCKEMEDNRGNVDDKTSLPWRPGFDSSQILDLKFRHANRVLL